MAERSNGNGILERIYRRMVSVDEDGTVELVQAALDSGQDVLSITDALTRGINKVGDKFELLEYFLPELIMAGTAMERSLEILQPELEKQSVQVGPTGTIVIARKAEAPIA